VGVDLNANYDRNGLNFYHDADDIHAKALPMNVDTRSLTPFSQISGMLFTLGHSMKHMEIVQLF
jgi:hypothetical protein